MRVYLDTCCLNRPFDDPTQPVDLVSGAKRMIGDKEQTGEQIRAAGIGVLFRELGPVRAIRFLQMFDNGKGDYSTERHEWVDKLSIEDALEDIRKLQAERKTEA